jgi:hypothetical protein
MRFYGGLRLTTETRFLRVEYSNLLFATGETGFLESDCVSFPPAPCSLLPAPCSLLPAPCSLLSTFMVGCD